MSYLGQVRARLILACFATSSLVLTLYPEVDLGVSGFFHGDRGFDLAASWWATIGQASVGYFICSALLAVVGIYAFNRVARRNAFGVDLRIVGYLLLVLVIGSGLVVNGILKNGFGRARPRNVVQFGGAQQFTPAFVVSNECDTNCSFSSGEGSGAFFSLALALALSRRRAPIVAAAVYGGLISFSRVAAGAHFLSDAVVSFFVMWITADALHYYLLAPRQGAVRTVLTFVEDPEGLAAPGLRGLATVPSDARVSVREATRDVR